MTAYRRLLALCIVLAVVVIGLGAYVRLSDAGLSCPDWPGCYGQLLGVPEVAADAAGAGKEMLHRYLAGSLGVGIFTLGVMSWRLRPRLSPLLPSVLVGIVIAQALLGMLTVRLRLHPLVVTAHLLGGMTTLALLVWLHVCRPSAVVAGKGQKWSAFALLAVVVQIALGGWVSSHYAGLACGGFPFCEAFPASSDFLAALQAPATIHALHRLGALGVLLLVGGLTVRMIRRADRWGWALLLLLAVQTGLGIANVLLALPLPLAVAHNLGAALLLAALVGLNARPASAAATRA